MESPTKRRLITEALSLSRTLEILQVPFHNRLLETLETLKNIVSLKTIIISRMELDAKDAAKDDIRGGRQLASRNRFREKVSADTKLRKLIEYRQARFVFSSAYIIAISFSLCKSSDQSPIQPCVVATNITARDLSFFPLASASVEERNAIWTKVMTFAMAHDGLNGQEYKAKNINLTRRSLPLVSKEFNVSLFICMEYIVVEDPTPEALPTRPLCSPPVFQSSSAR